MTVVDSTLEYRLAKATVSADAKVYYEMWDGRRHLVFPVVAAQEQVLLCVGCEPPGELLTSTAIEHSLPAWNGVPITLNHPLRGDDVVSVNADHTILAAEQVGHFFGATVVNGQLRGNVWLDEERTRRHEAGTDIIRRLLAGNMLEVSVGYFRVTDNVAGTWNDQPFSGTQRDVLPDHLALLVDEVGACSISDGCGAPRVNSISTLACKCRPAASAGSADDNDSGSGDMAANADAADTNLDTRSPSVSAQGQQGSFSGLWSRIKHYFLGQQLSDNDIRSLLYAALENSVGGKNIYIWIEAVYIDDGYVIYERSVEYPDDYSTSTYRQNYTLTDGDDAIAASVELDGDPVEVERVVQYKPLAANNDAATPSPQNLGDNVNRSELINELAGCECVNLTKEQLEALDDAALATMQRLREERENAQTVAAASAAAVDPSDSVDSIDDTDTVTQAVTTAVDAVMTPILERLEPVMASHKAAQDAEQQKKDDLITKLRNNTSCVFTEDELGQMALSTLEKYAQQFDGANKRTNYMASGLPIVSEGDDDSSSFAKSIDFLAHYRKNDVDIDASASN